LRDVKDPILSRQSAHRWWPYSRFSRPEWSEFLATDPGVVGLERGPLSLVSTIEKPLGRKSSGSGLKNREYVRRDPSLTTWHPLYPQKVSTNFVDKRRSLGQYSSLADSSHGV
jgi:hypothetical protein